MPSEGKKDEKIEVKDSRGFVIGDFATVINNFLDEKVIKRFGLEQKNWIYYSSNHNTTCRSWIVCWIKNKTKIHYDWRVQNSNCQFC